MEFGRICFSRVERWTSSGFDNIDWGQVGKATLSGAISGAIAGGIVGGVKYAMSAAKIANSLSGLSTAQANMDKAASVLKNTPMAFQGGVMVTEHVATQLAYNVASAGLGFAQASYNIAYISATLAYSGVQFGLKQLIGYYVNGWL